METAETGTALVKTIINRFVLLGADVISTVGR